MPDTSTNTSAYTKGNYSDFSGIFAYLAGGTNTSSNVSAYTTGHVPGSDSVSAFLSGTTTKSSSKFAYLEGILRVSISAYMEGVIVANNYISFTTSDSVTTKKFAVLQANYNPGALRKAQSARDTLGGGRDVSMGAIYQGWNPTIRVFVEENRSGYGNYEDLRYFYSLNNPNGTPSNVITFTDHLGSNHQVHIVGNLVPVLIGADIDGSEASYTVNLRLEKVTGE